jgi:hypothetical protein
VAGWALLHARNVSDSLLLISVNKVIVNFALAIQIIGYAVYASVPEVSMTEIRNMYFNTMSGTSLFDLIVV